MSYLGDQLAALPDLITVDHLRRLLGKNRATIYRWLGSGKIPGRKVGGSWIIVRDEVRDHLDPPSRGGA